MSADLSIANAFVNAARVFLRDEYLPKIERCLDQLTDQQIWWRSNEDSNSIGNLLLHLSGNARQWIISGLGGEIDQRARQAEFDERRVVSRADLISRMKTTLRQVDETLAGFDQSRLLETFLIQGTKVTALDAIFHVTEHFSMHTGQIILLTKMLVGVNLNFYDFSTGKPLHTWQGED